MYTTNGSYVLEQLVLSHVGGETDLKNIFLTLNLYESMEDIFMSGNVAVTDSFNIPDVAPLYGTEELRIRFHTAGSEENAIEFVGQVYKVSSKLRLTEHNSGYKIFFCSKEALKSKRTNVNQYYNDTIANSVKKTFQKFLKEQKQLLATDSKGTYSYSYGNIDPAEAIEMMSKKAVSVSNDHGYMFFENNKEFVFKPIQELYTQEPILEYGNMNAGLSSDVQNRNQQQFSSIQNIKMLEENSFLNRINDGLHGSDHYMFDLVTKDYLDDEQYEYNKEEWFSESKSLGKVSDKSRIEKHHDTVFLSFGNGDTDKQLHKDYIDTKMKIRESDMFRAEITVFGDSVLKCGDVIKVKFPNWNIDQEEMDTLFDGNVLVKKIWHMMTPATYMQVLQVNKDAYEKAQL